MLSLTQIFTIKNHPGLFKAAKPIKGGFVAESLINGERVPVTDTSDDAFCLAGIEIYGKKAKEEEENLLPLSLIFKSMQAHTTEPVDAKAHVNAIKDYFEAIAPEIDPKRVFASELRKIIGWYNLLKDKVTFESPVPLSQTKEAA